MTKLFDAFEPVSSKAWKQKIQVDLKGGDYNDILLWNSPEGIAVKPFYHQDTLKQSDTLKVELPKNWELTEFIEVTDVEIATELAVTAIQNGVETIFFKLNNLAHFEALKQLFTNKNCTIHFALTDEVIQSDIPSNFKYHLDIIGNLAKTGNWFTNLKEDHALLEKIVVSYNSVTVDSTVYQNAGANCVQQVAYAIAHANEYFNHFADSKTLKTTYFTSTGGNYFFEIAKIRALRYLHDLITSEFKFTSTCSIFAQPSKRNKTCYDYNSNLLRTTTESMSAILGGADNVCNLPYDQIYHHANQFGNRIARNQLLVLKHEAGFDEEVDITEGSYYIEQLTFEITTKALEIVKSIEKSGGFLKQLKEGIIQKKIKESAGKEQTEFDNQNNILVGSNKYQNREEKLKNTIEKEIGLQKRVRKTLIEPIFEKRLASHIEIERLKNE